MTNTINSTPLFSIITVVRNDEEGIRKTIDSVASQSFAELQHIIVDGASTDGTLAFLKEIKSKKIKWQSEPDVGLYDAMNKGLKIANGEYVCFLNAGDTFHKAHVLEQIAKELKQYNPDILFGSQVKVYPNGNKLLVYAHDASWIKHSIPASHQACFVRTELHKKFPFDLSYRISGDYNVFARMLSSKIQSYSSKEIVIYSDKSTKSVSYKNHLGVIRDCERTQKEVLKLNYMQRKFSTLKRLLPIAFWRISTVFPKVTLVAQLVGRGTSV